jgi:hypothetical protein
MGIHAVYRAAAAASIIVGSAILPVPSNAQAVVRGLLYDDFTGLPVRGTVMLIDPSTDAAVTHVSTDSSGQFLLEWGGGSYRISAVCAGYTSVLSARVSLIDGERLTLHVPIARNGDPRHGIGVIEHVKPDAKLAVTDSNQVGGMPDFQRRRLTGSGAHYDRGQLERANVATLGEFLQRVPGFSVQDPSSAASMQMTRNSGFMSGGVRGPLAASCHVRWFVDGHRMDLQTGIDAATDALGSMQIAAIEGVEVFHGVAEMPAELADPDLRCGAVSIWTRRS